MKNKETKYLLALNAHQNIGAQTIKKALNLFDMDPKKIWLANQFELEKKLGQKIATYIREAQENIDPEREITKNQKLNIGYITIFDKEYPKDLIEIADCPAVLYLKGRSEVLKEHSISIVGSRKFTSYGKRIAEKLSSELTKSGLVVVSGLALGIDSIAHEACLAAGGKTIAVLACGLDRIYPETNRNLADDIIKNGGLLVSEFPPGTLALKYHFPQRNRIIAGLSLGTVVVEAAKESGALITALLALEYNKEVFAVPGPIDSESSEGTNSLIQNGAKLVTKTDDILEEINFEAKSLKDKVLNDIPESEDEKTILKIINSEEITADKIMAESDLNIVQISSLLTIMEMKGILENVGGRWKRIK